MPWKIIKIIKLLLLKKKLSNASKVTMPWKIIKIIKLLLFKKKKKIKCFKNDTDVENLPDGIHDERHHAVQKLWREGLPHQAPAKGQPLLLRPAPSGVLAAARGIS